MVSVVAPHGRAAEVMPPAPPRHFNDYAQVVSPQAADRLNRKLEEFEKATSHQFVVAAFARMESPSSIEDYVRRIFQAWKIGQKEKNNGVLLAVFVQDRKLRIEVGYGLNGVLPDALARRIIDREITPHFKRGNYEAGLAAGINAIQAATRGEYRSTAPTKAQEPSGLNWFLKRIIFNSFFPWHLVVASALFVVIRELIFGRGETVYDSRGRHDDSGWGWNSDGGGWSSGGGGDGSSSGGGGFSGGGGSSGGGGASGSW